MASDSRLQDPRDEWVEYLGLSCRAYNCLKNMGIDTISDAAKLSVRELMREKNCGRVSAEEISKAVREFQIEQSIQAGDIAIWEWPG